jgi:hypothetical protein
MGRGKRDKIYLSAEQRQRLEGISRNGHAPVKKILHAQVLLMSDEGEFAVKQWTDEEIAAALNLHRNTVQGSTSVKPASMRPCSKAKSEQWLSSLVTMQPDLPS